MTPEEINRLFELVDQTGNKEMLKLFTKLASEFKKLSEENLFDGLTKTYNRRIIDKITGYNVVVMCDVDNFKQVNDTYGHEKGDEVLKKISEVFSDNFRTSEGDFIVRWGGDEFAIVMKNCTLESASSKMEVVKEMVRVALNEIGIDKTISVGIAEYEPGKELQQAMQQADQALYESKNSGKNKVTLYNFNEIKELKKEIS